MLALLAIWAWQPKNVAGATTEAAWAGGAWPTIFPFPGGELGLALADPFPFPGKKVPLLAVSAIRLNFDAQFDT